MREILFKAKRVDNGEWVEGDICRTPEDGCCIVVASTYEEPEHGYKEHVTQHMIVDHATVCFASSRADENKVKIFSDDMVEFTVFDHNGADTQHTGIVKWTGDRFIIVKSEEDPYFGSDGPFDLDWVCDQDDTIMVVGSIHDKKEGSV